jgi:hypothetical protein
MRIAFDLDETLGVPVITKNTITGLVVRTGAADLLAELSRDHELWLWTVSTRHYVEQILRHAFQNIFKRIITWDDSPASFKNTRDFGVDLLIDDSPHHRDTAAARNVPTSTYLVIPAFGDADDARDPNGWVRKIRDRIAHMTAPRSPVIISSLRG